MSGLRKEIAKGRLEVELIAGKQFTTLLPIAKMREMCRVPIKRAMQNIVGKPNSPEAAASA